jgi:hypothetical protein
VVLRTAGARTLFLRLDDLQDQLQVLLDAGRLCVTVLEGQAPVGQMALDREFVEAIAPDLKRDLRVGRDRLGHHASGHLNAVELNVATAVELKSGNDRERRETRHLLEEVLDRRLNQRLGVRG